MPGRVLALWVGYSTTLVYVLQGFPALIGYGLTALASSQQQPLLEAIPFWTRPEWIAALAAYGLTLGLVQGVLRGRSGSSVFWAGAAAALAYTVVASLILAAPAGSAESLVESVQIILFLSVIAWGNAWVAALVPVLLGLAIPAWRPLFFARLGPPRRDPDAEFE